MNISMFLYQTLAKKLPKSSSGGGRWWKSIRVKLASGFIQYCGTNVNIEKNATFPTTVSIGNNSGLGYNCCIYGSVEIGNDVMMGPDCHIFTHNHRFHRTDIPMNKQGITEEQPVKIGNDVWIGDRVTILPGVEIGNGAVIGASTVVTKNVPDFSIVAGNPGKIIGYRNHQNRD